MLPVLKKKTADRMDGAVEHLKKEFTGIRAGRASLSLLDGVRLGYFGTPTPLKQVATLSVPEARLITIQPWDATLIPEIEKAIMASDLGLTPTNDGKMIRLAIPAMTEERRKELIKQVRKLGEETRVAVRNHRRDTLEETKKLKSENKLSEDEFRKAQDEIQKMTDQYILKVDEVLKHKEAEILEK
jgi:ribosome recycling factor